ncbi:KpsF/GutQ family sugar-phosphate isomerase [Rickettsia endosymbiont of Cardiosporidium cionae]|uniref:KpsF/GutQ family sugar-phosphate isomerase n=1 Tax=Rickettsia endosymbiont of Cardiosporidium cionae TaxID=2777155 RepID=UPI0018934731|nr:KpsF/GutQ family sugar-phosphate isomerase [Rickettsia endosymbiont of Cardiosporidium cionae]KAF8818542.1 KpsF/GutQ family sugar-phosphate isomerase [Rickettsia endosymbiont of Cardiosporidium cionae]
MSDVMNVCKEVIEQEIYSLNKLLKNIPDDFDKLVKHIVSIEGGRVILTGIGKSGYIAQKIASSLSSTGTPSIFVHPSEANHGDLGMITKNDIVIVLSKSGQTQELLNLILYCQMISVPIAAITSNIHSVLANHSKYILNIECCEEASDIGAPTTSSVLMLSLCHAMVIALHKTKKFTTDNFKLLHPGGTIGVNLTRVKDIMRGRDKFLFIKPNQNIFNVGIELLKKNISYALVLDDKDILLGTISVHDIQKYINTNDTIENIDSSELVRSPSVFVEIQDSLEKVVNIMYSNEVEMLPVMDNKKIFGIITLDEINNIIYGK